MLFSTHHSLSRFVVVKSPVTSTPLFGIRGSKKQGEGDKVIKKGLFKLAAPKDSAGIKAKAARQVLETKKEEATEEAIANIANRSADVGHTWVKFRTMVGNQLKAVYSYGMWPEEGYGHPQKPVAGRIRHPDISHEKAPGEKQLFLDVEVSAKDFNKGLALAIRRLQEKPNYTLSDYNCTAFAQEIASAVGVAFPKAATVFPAEAAKGFRQKILSPNRLFSSMEKMKEKGDANISEESSTAQALARGQQEEQEQRQQEAQAQIEEELAAHTQYAISEGTYFWPGETFGDLQEISFAPGGDHSTVWSMNSTREFQDPDTSKMTSYTKVKAVINGKVTVGWIRSDKINPA